MQMGFKKYAYYNHGNKIAIVEKETSSTSANKAVAHCTIGGYDTKATCEAAGGQWIPSSSGIGGSSDQKYLSPKESVSDGIEVEYTCIPEYNLTTARNIGFNLTGDNDESVSSLYFSCYGDVNGYLTLFFPKITSAIDATGVNLNLTVLSADNYIIIHNHPVFNGIHKIQDANANGFIKTYTKWNSGLGKAEMDDSASGDLTYAATDDSITATGIPDIFNSLSAGDYIFIPAALTQEQNEGLFKVASINSTASDGILKVDTQYYLDITASTKGTLASQASAIEDQVDTTTNWMANKVLLCEGAYVDVQSVNILQDEDFDLDLTSYQSKAIVYYVKAKMSEEGRDMEGREYFMRLFKKQLEKERSARKRGPYIAMGNSNMRSY
jgi:hypothetical protein